METTTPNTDAKVGTLHLNKPLAGAPLESTQGATRVEGSAERTAATQTSRFPARAKDAAAEGDMNLETRIEDFFSSEWAESARAEVRKHPLAVVGVALVAGLLVGRL